MRLEATRLHAISHNNGFGDSLYDSAGEFPGLDLNFAANKNLTDSITGLNLIGFTRATAGTYVGADGLVKTAVTNLLLRSEEFDNVTSWSKGAASVTANAIIAPNGTLTADKLVEDTATNTHIIQPSPSPSYVTGTTYTYSVFAKAVERTFLQLRVSASATFSASFNLSTGVASQATAGTTSSVTNVGNNWYRCAITFTATATATGATRIGLMLDETTQSYTGDGISGIYIWGAQLETSATVGEYILTTSTINSAPRFDHNPTTGESLGLLVEEARTNLSLYSNDFTDASWTKLDCTIAANESTAPDGTLTADLWTNTASPGTINNSIAKDGVIRTYTASVWIKGTMSQFTITVDGGSLVNRGRIQYNLSTNTVGGVFNEGTFTGTSGTLTPYPNGWVRLTLTTTTSTGTTIRFRPFFSGTGSTVRIWGCQIEEGAFPTSYIPTTTATATRAADVASITGANFSPWYNQTEGTVFGEYFPNAVAPATNSQTLIYISNNTSTDRNIINKRANADQSTRLASVKTGATDTAFINAGTWLAANTKIAAVYKNNDYAASLNGAASVVDTTVDLFTGMTQANIGSNQANLESLNGTIKRLTYWAVRLANATLQAITTP